MTNFSGQSLPLPPGRVVLSSTRTDDGLLAPDSTAWLVEEKGL